MIIFSLLGAWIKKNWLKVVLPIGLVIVLFFAHYHYKTKYYNQGYNKCKTQVQEEAFKEVEKREKEYVEIKEKNDSIKKKVFDNIKKNPINDKRDSCILSNRPFKVDCL